MSETEHARHIWYVQIDTRTHLENYVSITLNTWMASNSSCQYQTVIWQVTGILLYAS